MSLYADYLTERTTDEIIETPNGFVTYRYIGETQIYIIDIYVIPAMRKTGVATELADRVVEEGLINNCSELLGTVNPSAKGSTASIDVLRAYGMTLLSSSHDVIVFRKGI